MESKDMPKVLGNKSLLLFLFLIFLPVFPLAAEERTVGEGEHVGLIINEGKEILKVNLIRPGQTIQIDLSFQWNAEKGKVNWRLDDQDGVKLRAGSQGISEMLPVNTDWTSNSVPNPRGYILTIQGAGGNSAGEVMGQYTLKLSLWDQNDADSGTDAPETYEKALLLPAWEAGSYQYNECFVSGTADVYDIYKILLQPGYSFKLQAKPLQWKGVAKKGRVRWEFLDKSFKRLKEGVCPILLTAPFAVRVLHPRVKTDSKGAVFYLMVKAEGEFSLIYSLEAEIKEGR